MVNGLDVFKSYFADYKDCYVLIGGSACDVYFADQDLPFRVTEDLDVILCVEALTPDFFVRFWSFVREGGYVNRQKANGDRQFYRFTSPTAAGFPKMVELFARKAAFLPDDLEGHLTPIPAGEEASSLSGILLERSYYEFVMANRHEVDGVTILNPISLIVLKAIAWLDLTIKKENGDRHAYSKDINKHKNDVARLTTTIDIVDYGLPPEIKRKMSEFMFRFASVDLDTQALGLTMDADDIKSRLRMCFGISGRD